ncbi:monovalent cation/H+ antiporter complex subunit F [Oceaniglobus roseus]|uniref:monovalent cation/H+ antiporter complex subunit F n=1 Tax=Oceaniglobus roseus TaxID=1737570 RepID=UPI000C7E91AA|nr:monovalent cation/H+ antiporter complex subunit F [Kandeliimicrobium roseum]
MTPEDFLAVALNVTFSLILAALVLGFYRLAKGPTLPDRVVALDMMTVLIVAFCVAFSITSEDRAFLDVALVLGLTGFLATVALARFAERRQARREARSDTEDGE